MLLSNILTANLLVIVEFACQGDLLGYLLKSRGLPDTFYQTTGKLTTVTANKMMMFAWQIADGMNFLAKNKVIKEGKRKWYKQKCGEIVPNFRQSTTGCISSTRSCLSLFNHFHINHAYIVRTLEL